MDGHFEEGKNGNEVLWKSIYRQSFMTSVTSRHFYVSYRLCYLESAMFTGKVINVYFTLPHY